MHSQRNWAGQRGGARDQSGLFRLALLAEHLDDCAGRRVCTWDVESRNMAGRIRHVHFRRFSQYVCTAHIAMSIGLLLMTIVVKASDRSSN